MIHNYGRNFLKKYIEWTPSTEEIYGDIWKRFDDWKQKKITSYFSPKQMSKYKEYLSWDAYEKGRNKWLKKLMRKQSIRQASEGALALRKIRMLQKGIEKKARLIASRNGDTTATNNSTEWNLAGVAQETDDDDRIGRKICIKSVYVHGVITVTKSTFAGARYCVVLDRTPNSGSIIEYDTCHTSNSIIAHMSLDNEYKKRNHKQKDWIITPAMIQSDHGTLGYFFYTYHLDFTRGGKTNGLIQEYDSTTSTSIVKNALVAMLFNLDGTNTISTSEDTKMVYTDI